MFFKGNVPHNKGLTGRHRRRIPQQVGFQKGHSGWHHSHTTSAAAVERSYERRTSEQPKLENSPSTSTAQDDSVDVQTKICKLRPVPGASATLKTEEEWSLVSSSCMQFINEEEMFKMFNTCIRKHKEISPNCEVPELAAVQRKKRGLCWEYKLRCKKCQFTSPTTSKLYKEVETGKPGPRPAAPNIALASALQDCPIGNTKTQEILARINCPPPSRTAMQRTSNRVGRETVELNKRDMAEKIAIVKAVNREKGTPANQINVTVDGRYNSQTISGRKKPGLNASQAISLAIETTTDKKYIIAAVHQNQLCWTGAWLRGKGFNVECPGGHENCTANLYRVAPVSEYTMGKEIGNQLALQDVLVRYATTDGDGRAAHGIADAMKALNPMWTTDRLADPVHLGQSQFRAGMRAQFSETMFKGRTQVQRKELKKDFCLDVKSRCSLVMKKLMEDNNNDIVELAPHLPSVLLATIRCYDGDCSSCKQHAVVCDGTDTGNWWLRSKYLNISHMPDLEMDERDKYLLQEILKMKLSEQAINHMDMCHSTNKNEGVHRALSVNLPKNVNFSRNMEARLASGVHRNNNQPGTSAQMKNQHLGIDIAPESMQYLQKMDREFSFKQQYEKSPEVKRKRLEKSVRQLAEHKAYKDLNKTQPEYRKGQLDNIPELKFHEDYCKKKMG